MQIDLDAGNAHPSQRHELVDGYRSPFVERKAGHISESDPVGWIVLGEIPRSASREVEELGRNDGIVDVFLGTGGIPLHAAFKGRKESCLVHRIEGYEIGHDHTTVPTTGKARRNAKAANPCLFPWNGRVSSALSPLDPWPGTHDAPCRLEAGKPPFLVQHPGLEQETDRHEKGKRVLETNIPKRSSSGDAMKSGGNEEHDTCEGDSEENARGGQLQGTPRISKGVPRERTTSEAGLDRRKKRCW